MSKKNLLKIFYKIIKYKITSNKAITTYKSVLIKVETTSRTYSFIQADGELIGTGSFICELLPKSINFIVP